MYIYNYCYIFGVWDGKGMAEMGMDIQGLTNETMVTCLPVHSFIPNVTRERERDTQIPQ